MPKKVKKPYIAYPGSTLQQNYAESLDHGYLLWEIRDDRTHDVKFQKLPNPKPFVTIDWLGTVEETLAEAEQYPDGARFRVRSNTLISQFEIKQLTNDLKKNFSACEVVYKIDQQVNCDAFVAGDTVVYRDDIHKVDVQLKLFHEFYKETQVSDVEWKEIERQISSYLRNVMQNEDSVVRNVKWSIKRYEFDNILSYGEGNSLNFEKLNGITGIFGQNRTGKSSLIGGLLYTLFNTIDRGGQTSGGSSVKNLNVINDRKSHCLGRAYLAINEVPYMVERQSVRHETKKGIQHAVTSLNLSKNDIAIGSTEDLNGEARTDTDKELRKLIGTANDFMLTSFAAQNDLNRFIDEGSTQRKVILSRFLDLDLFDKMHALANRDLTSISSQLKLIPDCDWEGSIGLSEERVNAENIKHETYVANVRERRRELVAVQAKLASCDKSVAVTEESLLKQRKLVNSADKKIAEIREKLSSVSKSIDDLEAKQQKIAETKEQVDVVKLRARLDQQRELETALVKLVNQHDRENEILVRQEKSVRRLSEVPCGDSFPTCKFIKDSHADKATLEEQRVRVQVSVEAKNEVQRAYDLAKQENVVEQLKKAEQLLELELRVSNELAKHRVERVGLDGSLETAVRAHRDLTEALSRLEEGFTNNCSQEYSELTREVERLNREVEVADSEVLKSVRALERAEVEMERLKKERALHDELQSRSRVQELIVNAFSKRGIPNRIINSQLPAINTEIAKILHGIVDFTVELEADTDSNSMDVFINYGDNRRMIELASGMEKMISSLAIRVALTNVTTLPKSDIFIIDEGFGSLDEVQTEACNKLLQSISRFFRLTLIISHVDAIKDVADGVIEIFRDGKDAKVLVL